MNSIKAKLHNIGQSNVKQKPKLQCIQTRPDSCRRARTGEDKENIR